MKRFALLLATAAPALAAASVPIEVPRETIAEALARTTAEASAAEARVAMLNVREQAASDEATRLRAERQRAAADIVLTEARLAAADVALIAARVAVASRGARLDRQRAPLAALLAGLATMSRRPPMIALADTGSIAELVRVRALIDGSMPFIARRSAALQAELAQGRTLAAKADAARRTVDASRAELVEQQRRFAALETRASARAAELRATASGVEDQVLAGGETVLDLSGQAVAASAARSSARALARLPLAAPRPFAPD